MKRWSSIVFFFFVITLVPIFAPLQLGGSVAYVIISGDSMEPGFRMGDLVLTRKQTEYEVGDVVVYHNPDIGSVFHRIINQEGERFTLMGDNNSWEDYYQPGYDDMIGKSWLHIPSGGKVIQFLRLPVVLALLSACPVILIFNASRHKPKRKSKHNHKNKMKRQENVIMKSVEGNLGGIIVLTMIALSAILIAVLAFTRPVEQLIADDVEFEHVGILLYQAADTKDVYDTDQVQSGEPVYVQLTCNVQLSYTYQLYSSYLLADEAEQLVGSYQFFAQIGDADGWNRIIELTSPTGFSGSGFSAGVDLDLCHIGDLIAHLKTETGTKHTWYDLDILPKVNIIGSVAGRELKDEFAPEIKFQFNQFLMRLPPVDIGDDKLESLTPMQAGIIPRTRLAPNLVKLFGVEIPVLVVRLVSIALFIPAVLGILWLGWPLYQSWKSGDASRIRVQYDPMLVEVEAGSLPTTGQVVRVDSFKDIVKMAERYGAVILDEVNGNSHRYCVQDGDTLYAYQLGYRKSSTGLLQSSSIEQELRDAVDLQQYRLQYQPIVSVENQRIESVEALVRWIHPEKGLIYPAEIISQAETFGLISMIDAWVVGEACRQLKAWQDIHNQPPVMSVNTSPLSLLSADFIEHVINTVIEMQIHPRYLQLEINHSNMIVGDDVANLHLHRLKRMGIRLAIDNFAAPSSNKVDLITRLPLTSLKIDRNVVHKVCQNPEDTRLISHISKLAHRSALRVVAEGVETQDQWVFLREHNIHAAQGYLIGLPVPAEELIPQYSMDPSFLKETSGN